jgi:hypothetical protein
MFINQIYTLNQHSVVFTINLQMQFIHLHSYNPETPPSGVTELHIGKKATKK